MNETRCFRDDLEKQSLDVPLKDVISASVGVHSSKQMLCHVTPAGCSDPLAAFESRRLLKKEIQFTLTCKLEDRTTFCFFGFTDMCRCGQSQLHDSVPSGCQQLHLGIHMALPTPQDFTLGGKRRKGREQEATVSLGTRPSLWTGKKFFSLELGLRSGTEEAAGQQCLSSPALEQKSRQEQGALGASCDN